MDADGVGRAQDRRDVVRLVDAVREHREVGLAALERATELGESLGGHRRGILRLCTRPRSTSRRAAAGRTRSRTASRTPCGRRAWARGSATCSRRHTSASLIICENADPDVRRDLETFMADVVPGRRPALRAHGRRPRRHARARAQRAHANRARRSRFAGAGSRSARGRAFIFGSTA